MLLFLQTQIQIWFEARAEEPFSHHQRTGSGPEKEPLEEEPLMSETGGEVITTNKNSKSSILFLLYKRIHGNNKQQLKHLKKA